MTNAPDYYSSPSFPDRGFFATAFDEAFAFQSLDHRWGPIGPVTKPLPLHTWLPGKMQNFNLHNGAPPPKP